MIRRDFRFLLQFNDLLSKLIEGGFVSKLDQDYRYARRPSVIEHDKAGFDGVFLLLAFMLLFDIIIGIVEQIVHWQCHRHNAHRNWKLISELIDGRRHYLILK